MGSGFALRSWGSGGLPPEKKICATNYAILNKFWYCFPILQQKVGDYPPVLKVGDLSPCPPPPAPTPMAIGRSEIQNIVPLVNECNTNEVETPRN